MTDQRGRIPVQAGELGPGVEQRQVDLGDVTLSVAEAGTGGRPLLLVHGFTGSKEDFGDWIHVFAEGGYHVVAPDQRGHGTSDQPEQVDAYSLTTYVHDLAGLVDALGWDHFALLGHSMGGFIAECYAVKHPEQIERLVLMDTHHGAVQGLDEDMRAAARHIVHEYGMSALVEAMSATESPLQSPAAARVEAEREGFKAWSDERLRATSPAMWLAMSEELVTTADRLDALTGLRMPVLVIVGDQDQPFLGASQRMAEHIPGARLVIIDDAGHSPQFEAPEAWFEAVDAFLREATA
jgi:pimeloyl-ACP methyl ester carboxylesterase